MAYPRIKDDGNTVELDLHGASVPHGLHLVDQLLSLVNQRGRSSIKIIHGSSTSDDDVFADTLKNRISDKLTSGDYNNYVTSHWSTDEYVILSPAQASPLDRRPISIFDLDK